MPDLQNLPEVLASWERRKVIPNDQFRALEAELRSKAFSLAQVWDQKLLDALYRSLVPAIRDGMMPAEWKKDADQILAAFGGRVYSGEEFSAWYSDLVFRMNTLSSYDAGRYSEMFNPRWYEAAPFWLFAAVEDERLCPICGPLDGKVFAKNDPEARKYLPRLHHNCRCQAVELDAQDVAAGDYAVVNGGSVTSEQPADGFYVDKVAALVPTSIWRAA